jgi:probable F420-dependent oxidoreductase
MRDFRFGFSLRDITSRADLVATCREAERYGYDTVHVPDHLGKGCPAPFPTMVAAAHATERMRVGPFVLNIGFWNPSVLAREAATTDLLTDGRLELGLGLGHMRSEFDAAGIPWQPFAERASRLVETLDELDRQFNAEGGYATAQRPRPPLMLAGNGDTLLRIAAERADILGLTGMVQAPGKPPGTFRLCYFDDLDERVAFFRAAAGRRADDVELNLLIQYAEVTGDRAAAAERLAERFEHAYTVDQILDVPVFLLGTESQIVTQVRELRERYGITYVSTHQHNMRVLGPLLDAIRG